ncbi:hypothetical protein P170DRAFT_228266 [Aspergillus steynii IBT 23096]|uniref:Uncharacterized protein n=1 Tax=Aspergillus steynii IBT 23096 TaxID=1392250 RepID=A0A2I2G246_9EURO|nr:uncharacterized protein P170DRAFT_228266 [Aspergillus steynii IBT 23096]PLB46948.1 hypothetical protein P170DRAFT_228266 [Aspergillus steynii IBT 23096]
MELGCYLISVLRTAYRVFHLALWRLGFDLSSLPLSAYSVLLFSETDLESGGNFLFLFLFSFFFSFPEHQKNGHGIFKEYSRPEASTTFFFSDRMEKPAHPCGEAANQMAIRAGRTWLNSTSQDALAQPRWLACVCISRPGAWPLRGLVDQGSKPIHSDRRDWVVRPSLSPLSLHPSTSHTHHPAHTHTRKNFSLWRLAPTTCCSFGIPSPSLLGYPSLRFFVLGPGSLLVALNSSPPMLMCVDGGGIPTSRMAPVQRPFHPDG